MFNKAHIILFIFFGASVLIKAQSASYLGPQVGWYKSSDADNSKFMFGGAFRTKLSTGFGLEASINYRQEQYNNGDVTVTSWPVMVTALLYPIDFLYGAIGVGWYNTAFDYKPTIFDLNGSSDTEQKFGWHFGAGVQFPLSGSTDNPNTILTADLRYVFLNYDFQQMPGASNLKSDFVVLNIGLLFHL